MGRDIAVECEERVGRVVPAARPGEGAGIQVEDLVLYLDQRHMRMSEEDHVRVEAGRRRGQHADRLARNAVTVAVLEEDLVAFDRDRQAGGRRAVGIAVTGDRLEGEARVERAEPLFKQFEVAVVIAQMPDAVDLFVEALDDLHCPVDAAVGVSENEKSQRRLLSISSCSRALSALPRWDTACFC